MALDPALLHWLLEADPALRWQVERDLGARRSTSGRRHVPKSPPRVSGRDYSRCKIPTGSGPAGRIFRATSTSRAPRQPMTRGSRGPRRPGRTLRDWGLDPAIAGTAELLAANSRWEYDDLSYWGGEVDCCINAYTLANGAWLGTDVSGIAQWFLDHRMADGGWNCEWVEGSTRSSFHSTLNSLKGLLYYEAATGGSDAAHGPASR